MFQSGERVTKSIDQEFDLGLSHLRIFTKGDNVRFSSLRKQPTFRYATNWFSYKMMSEERQLHKFQANDVPLPRSGKRLWLVVPGGKIALTNQKHYPGYWHVISVEFIQLFLGRHFAAKPVVALKMEAVFSG